MSVTIKDIAKIANVSIATVSKVINEKTHDISAETVKHVESILESENYVPNHHARSIKTNETKTIGLVIPDIRNAFFTDIARGAEDESFANGYSIFFASSDDKIDKEIKIINSMAANRVDGIIIVGSNERDYEKESKLSISIPAISIDRIINYQFIVSNIFTSNFHGAQLAVNHLLENGHKRIVNLAGPTNNLVSNERVSGYKTELENHNIEIDEKLIISGDFSISSGYERVMAMKNIDFTAIFASNDMIAIGAISALVERGYKVPEEVSVIGVDNIELAKHANPPLTTINQDSYRMGRLAVKNMIQHLKGRKQAGAIELTQEILIRDSVSKI